MIIFEYDENKLLLLTIKLNCSSSCATGFFFKTKKGKRIVITNRHFVEEKSKEEELDYSKEKINQNIWFYLNLDNGEHILLKGDAKWYLHPNEDLAFFDIEEFVKKYVYPGAVGTYFCIWLTEKNIPSKKDLFKLKAVENILMVGYPQGIIDETNNFPLIRKGITSSAPFVNYCKKDRVGIDIQCYPGSSGSPIILWNDAIDKKSKSNNNYNSEMLFLGIVNSCQIVQNNIEIINGENTCRTPYIIKKEMGLGYYIKSYKILEFCKFYDYF